VATQTWNPPTRWRAEAARRLSEFGLLIMLLALIVFFTAANNTFLTVANFRTLLEQNANVFIVAVGMTFAIISQNVDLAPGSLIALSSVALALVFRSTGSIELGILAGIVTAVGVELFDGFLIARLNINALVVTLAAWIWARGLARSLANADSIVVRHPLISFINNPQFPVPLVIVALAYLAGWFLLNRTKLGRYTFAIGGDERAAIQAGVPTNRYKLLMFGMMGLFVGVAMLVTVSRLGAAAPNAADGLELDAIVAVIIGGNPFQGGEGSLRKTFLGAVFIAVLNNGLNNLGMRDSYFYLYKGLAIILALLFGVISSRLVRGSSASAIAE